MSCASCVCFSGHSISKPLLLNIGTGNRRSSQARREIDPPIRSRLHRSLCDKGGSARRPDHSLRDVWEGLEPHLTGSQRTGSDGPVPLYGADTIAALLLAGSTLHIGLDPSHDGRLAHFTGALRKQLGFIGVIDVSCGFRQRRRYLAALGCVSNLFRAARREKTLGVSSRPIIDRPQSFAYCSLDGTRLYDVNDINDADVDRLQGRIEASERLKFIMEPGDVLFIPAGTIHTTETLDDTHSSSISLAFTPANLNKVLELLMQRAFADNPDWRHIPPVVSGKADAPVAGAYVAERIRELKALLDHVVHDDWSRAWAWQKAISQYRQQCPR